MVDNPRIVTVDGTHGLTRYGFHLLSICVINIFGQGLVCAHAISNRENSRIWHILGRHLRPAARACKPEVLMSDDTNSAWNGLRQVWPSLEHKLLCHWHIKSNVKKNCYAKAQKVPGQQVDAGTCVEVDTKKTFGHSAWEFFFILMQETDEKQFYRHLTTFRTSLRTHGQARITRTRFWISKLQIHAQLALPALCLRAPCSLNALCMRAVQIFWGTPHSFYP